MTTANPLAARSRGKKSSLREELLRRRYFLKDANGRPTETQEQMCRRVAGAVAGVERTHGANDHTVGNLTEQFSGLMTRRMFLPNSPTLMNAGRNNGMCNACFVIPVDDSLDT